MLRGGPGVLEIGCWVHSAHVGRGYATAAASALASAGLGQPGIERIEIHHDVANPASGRVAAKSGFHDVAPITVERKAPSDSAYSRVGIPVSEPDVFGQLLGLRVLR